LSFNEMSYDKNGNMIKDLDREIVTIRYNILNLPDTVQFKNGNQIINRYSADGSKLSTIYFTRVTAITSPIIPGNVCNWTHTPGIVIKSGKDIVTNLEYALSGNTRSLSKVFNCEGYAESITSNSYYYYRKDHLGSNHILWHATSDYTCNMTQYFPSGLTWAEGNTTYAMPNKFNGKEFVEMHGFDTYDYGARGYYPAIGRFTTMDPCAENDYSISPYAYCENNPVNRIDPDGRKDKNLLPEVVVTPGMTAKELGDRAWNSLNFGHGKDEEGGGYNVNASYGITKKTIIKGDDTGGTAGKEGDYLSLAGMYLHFQFNREPMLINMSSIDFSGTTQRELGLTGLAIGKSRAVNLFKIGPLNKAALAFGNVNMKNHGNNQFSIVGDKSSRFDFFRLIDTKASVYRNAGNILGAAINYNLITPVPIWVPLIFGGPFDVNFTGTTTIPK